VADSNSRRHRSNKAKGKRQYLFPGSSELTPTSLILGIYWRWIWSRLWGCSWDDPC